jgi:nitronate monooxygenase
VQVATRFTVTKECGLPDPVKQEYFKADEDDIEVNGVSPTGYPMRMIKSSPGIGAGTHPNCESFGYLLDANGRCSYIDAYNREVAAAAANPTGGTRRSRSYDKTCLCTHMRDFDHVDLRPLHLPPQGHLAEAAGRRLRPAFRRARVQGLPVQQGRQDRPA